MLRSMPEYAVALRDRSRSAADGNKARAMNHIPNFVQLTPLIATSGQPGPDDFHGIAAAGHVAVINIAMPDSENALADEGRRVTEVGMTYVHIPVPFDAPRARYLAQFTAALSALRHEPARVRVPPSLSSWHRHGRGWCAFTGACPLGIPVGHPI